MSCKVFDDQFQTEIAYVLPRLYLEELFMLAQGPYKFHLSF